MSTPDPFLESIDWGSAWIEAQKNRRKPDDAGYWDGRAASFAKTSGTSPYLQTFLEYAALEPSWSVFDMGAGSGTLSLPLAQAGHKVVAGDFSGEMLRHLELRAEEAGIEGITTVQTAWEDDWASKGIEPMDVVIASRSIAVSDLEAALKKMDAFARERVCLSINAGGMPRSDEILNEAIGRHLINGHDHIYAMNILFSSGIKPELRFIESMRRDFWKTREDAEANIRRELGELTPQEEEAFAAYLDEYLVPIENPAGEKGWSKKYSNITSWAFIAWDKHYRGETRDPKSGI